jgi:hypothetical protein
VNEDQERRSRINSGLEQVGIDIAAVLTRIGKEPDLVQALEDYELLALDAWAQGADMTVRAECRIRRAKHEGQARRFAARDEVELVPVLAERTRP